ncbi:translation elongation factor-like protein [Candidatus Parcubacteria bacterium]|nr:translation elongation factor-like protein [Candidatus Parcubacteria bacterium]
MDEKPIGKVTHFYSKLGVAIVKLAAPLAVGETIHVQGATTDFTQAVESMQVEHESVQKAGKGDVVGLKVADKVREHDLVTKVEA